jgi:hypothetical protein
MQEARTRPQDITGVAPNILTAKVTLMFIRSSFLRIASPLLALLLHVAVAPAQNIRERSGMSEEVASQFAQICVASGNHEGQHWLATFTVFMLTEQ